MPAEDWRESDVASSSIVIGLVRSIYLTMAYIPANTLRAPPPTGGVRGRVEDIRATKSSDDARS